MAEFSNEQLEKMVKEFQGVDHNIPITQEFEEPEKLFVDLIESVRKYHP